MTTAGQVRFAFPAFKVYIFGQDVTEDILSIDVNNHTGRAPNICTISLANERGKYILTTGDMHALFDSANKVITDSMSAFRAAARCLSQTESVVADTTSQNNILEDEINKNITILEPEIKRVILGKKIKSFVDNVEQPDITGKKGGELSKLLTGKAFRYPLHSEDPIFHANDPIRVFLRHPFDPRRWFYGFGGFLSDFDEAVDENNQNILTITAEDPTKLLRYARITTNPGIVDVKAVEIIETDAATRSFYESGFRDLTLPEMLFAIIFGNDPDGKLGGKFKLTTINEEGNKLPQQISIHGVGKFNFNKSAVIEYGPTTSSGQQDTLNLSNLPHASVPSLSLYQSLIDHEVTIEDIKDMAVSGANTSSDYNNIPKFADGSPDLTYIMDVIGKNPDTYPVDGGAVIILVPKSFQAEINREILTKELIGTVSMVTEFKSRLGMIYDAIERIEFVFYTSPKGDLICEFPLYDFDPTDFGNHEVEYVSMKDGVMGRDFNVMRGPFGPRFITTRQDTFNYSKGITDEKVRTQIASPYNLVQNWDKSVGSSTGILNPSVVTLRHLLPLYGARLEQVDPKGYVYTREGALAYAHIALNKMNADARTLGINALPNLGAWPNRPMYFEQKNCIGSLTGVSHSLKWGMSGDMSTRLNLNYIRGWDGSIDSAGNPTFTTIGGQPSRPFDYKLLFGLKTNQQATRETPSAGGAEYKPNEVAV